MPPRELLLLLARMTEGLRPVSESGEDQLDELRFVLARDLMARSEIGGDGTDKYGPDVAGPETLARFFEDDLPQSLRRFLGREARVSVAPRTPLGRLPVAMEGVDPGLKNVVPNRVLGPFRGPGGFGTIFDIFLPATRLALAVEGESRPLMLFSAARRHTMENNPDIRIEKGTVWVRADAIEPGAAAGSYVGFVVTGGQVNIESQTSSADGTITAKSPFKGRLTLQLETPEVAEDRCPDASAKMPESLKLAWNSGLTVTLAPGTVDLAGQRFEFTPTGSVDFVADIGHLVFAADVTPLEFSSDALASPLAELSGATQIAKAAWAVPLTAIADPANLPEAAGESAWAMWGRDPLSLLWTDGPAPAAMMDEPLILVGPDRYAIFAAKTAYPEEGAGQAFSLWQLGESGRRQPLRMTFPAPFVSIVGCDPVLGDYVTFTNRCHPVLNRPLDALGHTIGVPTAAAVTLINVKEGQRRILTVATEATDARDPIIMALENAYLSVQAPALMGFWGKLPDPNRVTGGELWLSYAIGNWVPTLPDPYVSNFALPAHGFLRGERRGRLLARIGWDEALPAVEFDGLLGFPNLTGKPPSDGKPGPGYGKEPWYLEGSQTGAGRITLGKRDRARWEKAAARAEGILGQRAAEAAGRNAKLDSAIDDAVRKTMGPHYGALLLDVSTNRHQIGVAIVPRIGRDRATTYAVEDHRAALGVASAASLALVIRGMSLRTQLDSLRVFTVPLVHWEPVRTLEIDQNLDYGLFPTPLSSANDGGATVIGQNSARLAPAIPNLALDDMVDEFAGGRQMAMVTTLPFGLRAGMVLEPSDQGTRKADTVSYTTPRFHIGRPLDGGLQLTLMAEGGAVRPGEESPSFRGATVQLLNGVALDTGSPLGISVLGSILGSANSVESMFNDEFADAKKRVPLTRYDVSGYGGTTFSDWQNPYGAFAEATKVQFQLMVGRTALEIVKFASVIYPWAIKVTRAVTIERKGGGGVIRRDTGWQPTTPGIFDFRYMDRASDTDPWVLQPSPYSIHPGLLKGLFRIERIRPASNEVIELPGGGMVSPMYFDADVAIDKLPGSGRTRCEGMLGYLHVKPVGTPLTPGDLKALFEREGAVGGPVDALVDVAGSHFNLRALRAEVDVADDAGTPVLVGAVRGTPVFGPSGSWSVVRQPGPANPSAAPDAELMDEGAPVIRKGRIREPNGETLVFATAQGDYRFAEAEDLFRASAPAWDVGFLQTAPTHAFLFRRPFIRAGDTRIDSTLAPCFADLLARSATQSLFPAVENAIQLTDRTYVLRIDAGTGFFRLDPSVNLANPRPELVLAEGTDRLRLFYNSTTLTFAIDETTWSLNLPHLEMWNDMADFEKVSGLRMDIVGGTSVRPEMQKIESLLHPTVEDIMRFIPGIFDRGTHGPVDLSATNVKVEPKIATYSEKLVEIPRPIDLTAKSWVATDVGSESETETGATSFYAGTKVGMDVRGRTSTSPWSVIYGCAFEIGGAQYISGPLVNQSKLSFEAKLYVGIAYGGPVGPFEALVSLGLGPEIQYSDSAWKYGGFLFFEAKVDLSVVKVIINAEFAMVGYSKTDAITSERKSFIDYQGELGINVSFGWIISIKFTVEVVETQEVS